MDILPALRWVALAEAVSYLVLGSAMGYRFVTGEHWPVRVSGMVHGVLFLLLVWLLVQAHVLRGWSLARVWLVFLASLVPIVPFFLDGRVRGWIAEPPPPRS